MTSSFIPHRSLASGRLRAIGLDPVRHLAIEYARHEFDVAVDIVDRAYRGCGQRRAA